MNQKKTVKVTLSIARKLIKQELGIPTTALKKLENPPYICQFQMQQGNMFIQVENDWFNRDGRIRLTIQYGIISTPTYFFPDTLLEDSQMAIDEDHKNREEVLNNWVYTNGPEFCHKIIDKTWDQG